MSLIDISICDAIRLFSLHINDRIVDINDVCICYSLFFPFKANTILIKIYLNFVSTIKIIIIVENHLNCYKYKDAIFNFCKSYYKIVIKIKIPKFEFANCINVLSY